MATWKEILKNLWYFSKDYFETMPETDYDVIYTTFDPTQGAIDKGHDPNEDVELEISRKKYEANGSASLIVNHKAVEYRSFLNNDTLVQILNKYCDITSYDPNYIMTAEDENAIDLLDGFSDPNNKSLKSNDGNATKWNSILKEIDKTAQDFFATMPEDDYDLIYMEFHWGDDAIADGIDSDEPSIEIKRNGSVNLITDHRMTYTQLTNNNTLIQDLEYYCDIDSYDLRTLLTAEDESVLDLLAEARQAGKSFMKVSDIVQISVEDASEVGQVTRSSNPNERGLFKWNANRNVYTSDKPFGGIIRNLDGTISGYNVCFTIDKRVFQQLFGGSRKNIDYGEDGNFPVFGERYNPNTIVGISPDGTYPIVFGEKLNDKMVVAIGYKWGWNSSERPLRTPMMFEDAEKLVVDINKVRNKFGSPPRSVTFKD